VNLVRKAMHALNMMSNGSGLKITEQFKIPGYRFWVWFSERAEGSFTQKISVHPLKKSLKNHFKKMKEKIKKHQKEEKKIKIRRR
jgi:hypothetical protein